MSGAFLNTKQRLLITVTIKQFQFQTIPRSFNDDDFSICTNSLVQCRAGYLTTQLSLSIQFHGCSVLSEDMTVNYELGMM